MTAVDAAFPVASTKRSFLQRNPILRRLLRHKAFMVGAILFVVVAFVAIFAALLTDADPNRMAVRFRFRPPSGEFLFGTEWTPLFSDKHFGVLPLVGGTVLTSLIAMAVALPAGLLTAIFLSEKIFALHKWLANGGFLPSQWRKAGTRPGSRPETAGDRCAHSSFPRLLPVRARHEPEAVAAGRVPGVVAPVPQPDAGPGRPVPVRCPGRGVLRTRRRAVVVLGSGRPDPHRRPR